MEGSKMREAQKGRARTWRDLQTYIQTDRQTDRGRERKKEREKVVRLFIRLLALTK